MTISVAKHSHPSVLLTKKVMRVGRCYQMGNNKLSLIIISTFPLVQYRLGQFCLADYFTVERGGLVVKQHFELIMSFLKISGLNAI